jgi:hypothetical protein
MGKLPEFGPLGRPMRMDKDLGELGKSSLSKLKAAIQEGDTELALELSDYLATEYRGVHHVLCDVWFALADWIARNYGEEELPKAYRHAKERLDRTALSK